MGMDYIGRDGSAFHLNWSGHLVMARLLHELGADLDRWSGANDGHYVPAPTCRAWASAVREAVTAGRVRFQYLASSGGTIAERRPVVDDATPRDADLGPILDAIECLSGTLVPEGEPQALSAADRDWLLDFAEFLEGCRGCWQW